MFFWPFFPFLDLAGGAGLLDTSKKSHPLKCQHVFFPFDSLFLSLQYFILPGATSMLLYPSFEHLLLMYAGLPGGV